VLEKTRKRATMDESSMTFWKADYQVAYRGQKLGFGRVNGGKEGKRKKWLIGFIHMYQIERMMKSLAIALSGVGRGSRRGDRGGDLINVQYKTIQNCHNESSLYTNIS
jgi:hypothetical protein